MLIFFGTAFLTLVGISASPARYDQRQQGDFNLDAKLENLLFVIAIPSNKDFLTDVALQALELKHQLKRSNSPKDQESIKADEGIRSEEPYSVEIIRINENPSDEGSSTRRAEGESIAKVSIGNRGVEKAVRSAKNVKDFEFPKSREVPTVVKYLLNPREIHVYKTQDGGRARNVLGIVWNPDVQTARSGKSLKKQLIRREEKEDDASSSNAGNDVTSLSEEKQELWLLGSTENCGPESHRDASGICQFNKSAGSLL